MNVTVTVNDCADPDRPEVFTVAGLYQLLQRLQEAIMGKVAELEAKLDHILDHVTAIRDAFAELKAALEEGNVDAALAKAEAIESGLDQILPDNETAPADGGNA